MRQRLILVFLSISLMATLLLPGCSQYEEYEVMETGNFDGLSKGLHKEEYKINLGDYENNIFADKEKSIEWQGEHFSGVYEKTMTSDLYSEDFDYYTNKEKKLSFAINPKTDELFYYLSSSDEIYNSINKIFSEDECRETAEAFLKEFIDDFDQYSIMNVMRDEFSTGGVSYTFFYSRDFGGIHSTDNVCVGVFSSNDITWLDLRTYGTLKDAELPEYNEEKVQEAIDKKLETIYENIYDENEVKFKEKERLVMKLDDGSMGLKISVEAEIIPKDTNSKSYYELTELIVCLGN